MERQFHGLKIFQNIYVNDKTFVIDVSKPEKSTRIINVNDITLLLCTAWRIFIRKKTSANEG